MNPLLGDDGGLTDHIGAAIDEWQKMHPDLTYGETEKALMEVYNSMIIEHWAATP